MNTENFNPFLDDERETTVTTSTLVTPIPDKTKHTRGNPKAQPWKTKTTKTEAEKLEIQRALLNGESVKGYKTRKAGTIYKRAQMTEKDLLVLTFLAKFDYATTRTLSVVTGVGDAGKRLRGLREWGFLNNPENTMNHTIWTISHKAAGELKRRKLIDFTPKVFTKNIPLVPFAHTLGISHTAALLLSGDKNPYIEETGKITQLNRLVGERELMKAMETHFSTLAGGQIQPQDRQKTARTLKANNDQTAATLYSPLATFEGFHRPDIVITYGGKAIAVEVELTTKSKNETDAILESYKRNYFGRIVRTIYICKDDRVGASIGRAQARTKTEEQIVRAPIFTRNGELHFGPTNAL